MTDEALEDLVKFGEEAKAFLRSRVGEYLLARSKDEITVALHQLKTVAPDNVHEIRRLQAIIARNEDVESWLAEIITAANEARDELEGVE